VLDAEEYIGHGSNSRSLNTLIHGYSLRDAWQARPGNTVYTHYTAHGATRLDRFYLTEGLLRRKTDVATVVVVFTDYLAVIFRLSVGASFYGGDEVLGNYVAIPSLLRMQWIFSTNGRSGKKHLYPNINLWWSRHCKKRLRQNVSTHRGGTQARPSDLRIFLLRLYICPCAYIRYKP
jgi:hypothetical protein